MEEAEIRLLKQTSYRFTVDMQCTLVKCVTTIGNFSTSELPKIESDTLIGLHIYATSHLCWMRNEQPGASFPWLCW
uniref:Uncharacterized protein n=1 Tax=Anguilla anguilla TaxID=7936 RepID=A0A0E9RWF1_ANGAN